MRGRRSNDCLELLSSHLDCVLRSIGPWVWPHLALCPLAAAARAVVFPAPRLQDRLLTMFVDEEHGTEQTENLSISNSHLGLAMQCSNAREPWSAAADHEAASRSDRSRIRRTGLGA